jgi:carbonic anhydrase/acetyltransferase-like protein (isoleucine patch superfamily)
LQDHTVVHVSGARPHSGIPDIPTIIGSDVLVGHRATIHACTIGDGAFIGMGSTVLDGAVVEPQAMVAAGAVVGPGKRVPSGELWAGTPARFMRKLSEKELAGFKFGTDHYAEIGAEYRKQLTGR